MRKEKERKTKETNIGKIIYGFLLFMPLLAILSNVIIKTFNNSTKQENKITYKYESNEVINENSLVEGNIYHVKIDSAPSSNVIFCEYTAIYNFPYFNTTTQGQVTDGYVKLDLRPNNTIISSSDGYWIYSAENTNVTFPIEFDAVLSRYYTSNYQVYDYHQLSKTDFNVIDEVTQINEGNTFYNAIEEVEESNLFNWATNSIIYTGIANTCTQLSITNTFIPLLMAYWLIISVIYILYDIILMMLILFHRKVHELQNSI